MSARDDSLTVEARLSRVSAIMVAMQCVTAVGDDCQGDTADVCAALHLIALDEMRRILPALDVEVLNRDC